MHFDHGDRYGPDGIVKRDGRVPVSARIDDNAHCPIVGFVKPVDEDALMIALKALDLEAKLPTGGDALALDIFESLAAINAGFSLAQHIQVRPVEDKDCLAHGIPTIKPAKPIDRQTGKGKPPATKAVNNRGSMTEYTDLTAR